MKFVEQQRSHIPADVGFVKTSFLNLPYAPGGIHPPLSHAPDGNRHTLDIYLPNKGTAPYPVIVDIFGGGWYFGNKSSHKLEPALNLLKRGFAVVSINYSLSSQGTLDTQIQEVKASIRYIRKNAKTYQLDPDRIALLGESAGAHLAAVAATSSASGALVDPAWPNQEVSDAVQAVIAVYCPVYLDLMKELFCVEKMAWGLDTVIEEYGQADSMEGVLLGGPAKQVPDAARKANPITYLDENCPPFLFLHGNQDQVVPIIGAMNFAAQMMGKIGVENVEFQVVDGAHHDIHDFEKDWIYDLEADFLRRRLQITDK